MPTLSKQKTTPGRYRSSAGRLLFIIFLAASFLQLPLPALAQDKTVRGRITSESGSPVVGATVTVKGTTIGTSTNPKGEFSILASKGAVLVISNVGFMEKELTVGDAAELNVQLQTATQSFDEVVV